MTMVGIPVNGIPLVEIASALAVLLALTRTPRARPAIGMAALLIFAMVGLMFLSAELNDLTPYRRLLHLVLYAALAVVASQGRFHHGAMSRGLAFGLVVSGLAYFGGTPPATRAGSPGTSATRTPRGTSSPPWAAWLSAG